jgi:hypothetical protein
MITKRELWKRFRHMLLMWIGTGFVVLMSILQGNYGTLNENTVTVIHFITICCLGLHALTLVAIGLLLYSDMLERVKMAAREMILRNEKRR